jgi:hypothetical protein
MYFQTGGNLELEVRKQGLYALIIDKGKKKKNN